MGAKRAVADPDRPGRFLVEVTWADGRTGRYPWGYLRAICPCANCRHEVRSRIQADPANTTDSDANRAASLQNIGHYALGIAWADGHQSILPWDYLRETDPDEHPLEERLAYLSKDRRLA